MSYLHINNLYKDRDILLFKECYALEKIHGTSAHVQWKDNEVKFFSGGCKHETFVALFNKDELEKKFKETGVDSVIVYGEAYGGKLQGMRETYGDKLQFVAFEVKIGNCWLSVPQAYWFVADLGLEFIAYENIPTTLEALNRVRDAPSIQAFRNGCGNNKMREGIVLRPPIELTKNNGERVIAKYKREEFRETKTKRPVKKERFEVLQKAREIADEWVTEMRLTHVLDAFPDADITKTGMIIKAMVEDVLREAKGEIMGSGEVKQSIGRTTALMFKRRIKEIK